MKTLQFKTSGTVKDVDLKTKTVTGYFAAFDNVDADNDVFLQGAFSKSIKERGPEGKDHIFHLLAHNIYQPLGKPSILREDKKGLYFETPVADTTYGIDTLKLYEGGVYKEHSVGFITIQSDKRKDAANEEETEITEIKEVKLFEGSTVLWGANDQTPFSGFKEEMKTRIDFVTKVLKIKDLSDETLSLFEFELFKLQSLLKQEPSPDTLPKEPDYAMEFANCFTNLKN